MQSGLVAGYPVVDVAVELYDGSYHEVDSSEMAFKMAGSMAMKEAMKKGNSVLLEPFFKVEANVGAPQVAYRETITQPVDVEYKYSKQSGGRGQYGHVKLRVTPQEPGAGRVFC